MAAAYKTSMLIAFLAGGMTATGACHAWPKYNMGTPATPAQIAGWYIDVAPDGKNLPLGHGQVMDGEKLYSTQCASCHGAKLEGGLGPSLIGGEGTLATAKPIKTIGSYWPYATTVFDYIRRAMPLPKPQSLTNNEVYALTGFLLYKNGLLPESADVDAKTLMEVKMPNRNGFYLDNRPDAHNKACYLHCLATK